MAKRIRSVTRYTEKKRQERREIKKTAELQDYVAICVWGMCLCREYGQRLSGGDQLHIEYSDLNPHMWSFKVRTLQVPKVTAFLTRALASTNPSADIFHKLYDLHVDRKYVKIEIEPEVDWPPETGEDHIASETILRLYLRSSEVVHHARRALFAAQEGLRDYQAEHPFFKCIEVLPLFLAVYSIGLPGQILTDTTYARLLANLKRDYLLDSVIHKCLKYLSI